VPKDQPFAVMHGGGTYGYNNPHTSGTPNSTPLSKIPKQSSLIAFGDGVGPGFDWWSFPSKLDSNLDPYLVGGGWWDFAAYRHRGKAMTAFWDGHTQSMKPEGMRDALAF
jgi:prepilin-type processing-associated H-X9-DG protein